MLFCWSGYSQNSVNSLPVGPTEIQQNQINFIFNQDEQSCRNLGADSVKGKFLEVMAD